MAFETTMKIQNLIRNLLFNILKTHYHEYAIYNSDGRLIGYDILTTRGGFSNVVSTKESKSMHNKEVPHLRIEQIQSEHRTTDMQSYISPKIELLESNIHGLGMFAKKNIQKGEVTFIKGGHILEYKELFSSEVIFSYLPIDDKFFIGAKDQTEELTIKLFNNHSCEPNCAIRGEITFIALRDIVAGEELTCDYATIDNEEYEFLCNCKNKNCRKIITGFDWKKKDLQIKYKGYFARYLTEKIISNVE